MGRTLRFMSVSPFFGGAGLGTRHSCIEPASARSEQPSEQTMQCVSPQQALVASGTRTVAHGLQKAVDVGDSLLGCRTTYGGCDTVYVVSQSAGVRSLNPPIRKEGCSALLFAERLPAKPSHSRQFYNVVPAPTPRSIVHLCLCMLVEL
jgi:hypothetical protein